MKLKKEFIVQDMGDTQVMVSTDASFNGIARSNKSAAFIIEQLKSDVTEDDIVKAMVEKYDAPEDVLRADVKEVIATLNSIGAIE